MSCGRRCVESGSPLEQKATPLAVMRSYVHMCEHVCALEVWPVLLSLVILSYGPDFVFAAMTVQSWGWPVDEEVPAGPVEKKGVTPY